LKLIRQLSDLICLDFYYEAVILLLVLRVYYQVTKVGSEFMGITSCRLEKFQLCIVRFLNFDRLRKEFPFCLFDGLGAMYNPFFCKTAVMS
jgi:hypothetical protein